MGVAYQIAKLLGIKTVTFEFADQRERIWLAQDDEIMSHHTDELWRGLAGSRSPRPLERQLETSLLRAKAQNCGATSPASGSKLPPAAALRCARH